MIIELEDGRRIEFDGTPTEKDIEEAAIRTHPRNVANIPESEFTPKNVALETLKGTAGTIARSGGRLLSDVGTAMTHPVQTAKGVFNLGTDVVKKAGTLGKADTPTLDALTDIYKDRYGGLEETFHTVSEDPIGFLSDVSIATGALGAVSKLSKGGKIAKAGSTASKISRTIDPVANSIKASGAVLKKVTQGKRIAPFIKKLNPEAIRAAREIGVDIPASGKTTTRIVPALESIVAKGFFGQKILDKIDDARLALTKYADDVVSKTGKAEDLVSAGKAISEGLNVYRYKFIKIKDALYDKAILPGGKKSQIIKVNPSKTRKFVNTILRGKELAENILGKSTDISYFRNLAKNINVDIVDGRFIKAGIKELNQKIKNFNDPLSTGNKATLKKLVASLSDDLDRAIVRQRPELAEAISKANEFYKAGELRLNSSFGKKIVDLADAGQYDKILPAIINKGTSVLDVPKIYAIVGKGNIPGVQTAFLETFFEGARNADGTFTPLGVTKQINRLGGNTKLKAILTPQQYQSVKNIEAVSKSFRNLDRITKGSQTAFLTRVLGEGAVLASNPLIGLKIIAGDIGLSQFISSPTGQRLLAEGVLLKGATGKALIKAGENLGTKGSLLRVGGMMQE